VHAGAVVSGGSVIEARAKIDAGATVTKSVIADGAHVAAGAVVENSIIGRRAEIGPKARLDGVVVGEGAQVGGGNELANGIRIWTDATIPDAAIRFTPLP